ncbi:MAG: DUF2066 domain-containing protein [Wenzhouxiangellaceae bacterium]
MKILRLSCVLLLVWSGGYLPALAADLLYVGEAVVEPAVEDARSPIERALAQVMTRLTGSLASDPLDPLGLQPGQAETLALAREFRRVEVPLPDGRARVERRLRVEFDPPAVNRLLDRAGIARWGRERPDLLVWVVVEGETGAEFLVPDQVLEHRLREAEFRYGLSLLLPLLDGLDRVEVSPADVRGGFVGMAVPAMRRHGADGLVMLDLRESSSFWTGRWTWLVGGQEQSFERSAVDRLEAIELGLARIAESLAARFAVRAGSGSVQRLAISGISRPAQYHAVRRFLEGLTGIESVRLIAAGDAQLEFEVRSSVGGLRSRIELTGPLEFVRHDLATNVVHYQFGF